MTVDRESRLLVAIFATLSAAMWLIGALVHQAREPAPECTTDADCHGQDNYCSARGFCKRETKPPEQLTCRAGNPCPGTKCTLPEGSDLECIGGHYRRVLGTEICRDPTTLDFLQKILKKCGDASQCTPAQLKDLVISTKDFDVLLGKLDGAFAVHFDYGKPREWDRLGKRQSWNNTRKYYVEQLGPHMATLTEAQMVLLVATSSATGPGNDKNDEMALRRLLEVRYLLEEAARPEVQGGNDLREKLPLLKDTNLSDAWQLNAERYRLLSLKSAILWDTRSQKRFLGVIDRQGRGGDMVDDDLPIWAEKTLNQAVYVIPIPCKIEMELGGR